MADRRPSRTLPRRLGTTPAPAPEGSQSAPTSPTTGAEINPLDHLVGDESELQYRSSDRLPAEQRAQEQYPPPADPTPSTIARRLSTTPALAPDTQAVPTTPPTGIAEFNPLVHLVGAASVLHSRSTDPLPAEQRAQGPVPLPIVTVDTPTAQLPGPDPPHYSADDLLAILGGANTPPAGRVVERNLFTGTYRPVNIHAERAADRGPNSTTTSQQGEGDSTYYQDPPPMPQRRAAKRDLSAGELPPAQRLDLRASPPSPIHAGPMRTSSPIEPVTTTTAMTATTYTVTTTFTRATAGPLPIKTDPRFASAHQRAVAQSTAPPPPPQPSPQYELCEDAAPLHMSYSEMAAVPPPPQQPAEEDTTEAPRKAGIPPIQVDVLPNWTGHFKALKGILGAAPSARPMGKGVRFLPRTIEEYRAVQAYLEEARQKEPAITGHTFVLDSDRPHKVAVYGLPRTTPMEELLDDLGAAIGVQPEYGRMIPPRRGRPKTTFFIQFPHLSREQLQQLYNITELLCMPGIEVKEWKRRPGPPQCHRCQAFGHSSAGCFQAPRCVRCAGPHPAADCPRETAQLKCCNCGKNHAANSRQCPAFRREARRRGIELQAPLPEKPKKTTKQAAAPPTRSAPPPPPTHSEPTQALNLMAPANGPTERGASSSSSKKKTKRGGKRERNRKIKKTKEDKAPTEEPTSGKSTRPAQEAPTARPEHASTVPQPPLPAALTGSRRERPAELPQLAASAPSQADMQNAALQDTIGVLLEVLQRLQAGASPLEAVTYGFARLCGLYRGV